LVKVQSTLTLPAQGSLVLGAAVDLHAAMALNRGVHNEEG
jgi:hypothetical protein